MPNSGSNLVPSCLDLSNFSTFSISSTSFFSSNFAFSSLSNYSYFYSSSNSLIAYYISLLKCLLSSYYSKLILVIGDLKLLWISNHFDIYCNFSFSIRSFSFKDFSKQIGHFPKKCLYIEFFVNLFKFDILLYKQLKQALT